MTATAARRTIARSDEIARIIARLAHQIVEPNEAQGGLVLLGVRRGGEALAMRLAARDRAHRRARTGARISQHQSLSRRPGDARACPSRRFPWTSRGGSSSSSTTCSTPAERFARRSTPLPISGGPPAIRLCVLVDRGLRELPIQADYVGRLMPTTAQQRVKVVLRSTAVGSRRGHDLGKPRVRIRRSLIDLDDLTAEETGLHLRANGGVRSARPRRRASAARRA